LSHDSRMLLHPAAAAIGALYLCCVASRTAQTKGLTQSDGTKPREWLTSLRLVLEAPSSLAVLKMLAGNLFQRAGSRLPFLLFPSTASAIRFVPPFQHASHVGAAACEPGREAMLWRYVSFSLRSWSLAASRAPAELEGELSSSSTRSTSQLPRQQARREVLAALRPSRATIPVGRGPVGRIR
jgi:hypothetical protein